MDFKNNLLTQVEDLHKILTERATGGSANNEEYIGIRRELIKNQIIKEELPIFLSECRTLGDFWDYIKAKFGSYAERRNYLREEFSPLYNFLENNFGETESSIITDLFKHQFPIGMPFGIKKPHVASIPEKGSQKISFEDDQNIGVIRENVYPNFTYKNLENCLCGTPISNAELKLTLSNMSQTASEKLFFDFYSNYYDMWHREIPVLIPQAWIQWHSSTKKELRSNQASYSDDLYRVDFVAFWNNKRFAILIDDISHYAKKNYSYWNADQEKYSMRLKEDRKLRKERWNVFRISNWELRQGEFIKELSDDLLEYIEV
jgi:hypothetical protein